MFGYALHHTSVCCYGQHATNKVLQSYTIVAVRPGSEEIFKFAVSSGVVDVVSFDLGQELPFYIRKPQVRGWCGWWGALLLVGGADRVLLWHPNVGGVGKAAWCHI